MPPIPSARSAVHPHVEILQAIYTDLPKIAEHAADDIVLHRADRSVEDLRVCRGLQAVLAHEQVTPGRITVAVIALLTLVF
ncbi:hypothetical protein, partial [Streptomyces spectabilis]|uniref:hypothetical protein n=1 Tax=Streptomyces spectabilis TaxID=68270 RepID=UPI0033C1F49D